MGQSILLERANSAISLMKGKGESHFPFTHPAYPHQAWLTAERQEVADGFPVPVADPFAKGQAGGLHLWDVAAAPTPWMEFRTIPPQKIPAFRKTNTTWLNETVPSFYKVGTVQDGVIIRRPKNRAVVDLMMEPWGWQLLEAAHALAHRAEIKQRFKPLGYGLYGNLTINWVSRLVTAMMYDIPVDVSCEPTGNTIKDALESNDGLLRYGISICDSNCFHSPFLRVPCIGKNAPVPDRDLCFMALGVYIEPHPKGATDGTGKWMEVNRWSCMPTMISFAGWELADTIFKQQPTVAYSGSSTPEYVIAAPSLFSFDGMQEYIDAAKSARGEAKADNVRYWKVLDWLHSKNMRDLVSSSPTLPCSDCLRLNMRAEGAPGRPQSTPPKEKPDKNSKFLTREEKEWIEWDNRIDGVFDTIEKSVMYYEARLLGATAAKRARRARKHAARVRSLMVNKVISLEKKAVSAMRGGKPSVAERLRAEAGALQEAIRNDILITNEKENKSKA